MRLTDDIFVQVRTVSASGTPSSGADVMLGTAYADILDPLVLSSVQLGISRWALRELPPTLEALIAGTRVAGSRCSCCAARQSNPQKQCEGHDFNEVAALSIVVPHCDILVNEPSHRGLTLVGPGWDAQPTNRAAAPC
jgi:hypothetical protein